MAPRYDDEKGQLQLSAADLIVSEPAGGGPFTLTSERASGGRAAHLEQSDRRANRVGDSRSEVPVELELEVEGATVTVRGRLDGIWEEEGRTVVEEVKSRVLDRGLPRRFHISQLLVYLWMVEQSSERPVTGLLTYVFPDGRTLSCPVELGEEQRQKYRKRIAAILNFQRAEVDRLKDRATHTGELTWPFAERRDGQSQMEDAAAAAVRENGMLMLEAPTGVGKTAPLLLGALREALQTHAQLLIATSRTAQQPDRLALVDSSAPAAARGRVLLLGSRQRLGDDPLEDTSETPFEHIDPLLPPDWALEALDSGEPITPEVTRDLARRRGVSAMRLQRLFARYADVIIGDQNLLANPDSSYLPPESSRSRVLLLDEAHGLADRQRERDHARITLDTLRNLYREFQKEEDEAGTAVIEELGVRLRELLTPREELEDVPRLEPFDPRTSALAPLAELASAHVASLASEAGKPQLLETSGHLRRLSLQTEEAFDYLDRGEGGWQRERLDAGLRLASLWERLDTAIVFSGTLKPMGHFRGELGLPAERTRELLIPEQTDRHLRLILRHAGIATTYKRREASAPNLAQLLSHLAKTTGGRWVVFFPSRAYLEMLEALLKPLGVRVNALRAGMPAQLLERMGLNESGPSLLLALMGGTAAEGIDLPGGEFDGCAVVSPAVAPASPRSELLAALYEQRGADGRLFASVLPGLIRVRQAAGRLWRGPDQRGALVLIGERFGDPDLEELMPESWSLNEPLTETSDLLETLSKWRTR